MSTDKPVEIWSARESRHIHDGDGDGDGDGYGSRPHPPASSIVMKEEGEAEGEEEEERMVRSDNLGQEEETSTSTSLMGGQPLRLEPKIFLGSAVAANSYHVLHYLGVTHILNCTEADEIHAPPEEEGFVFLRCPVKDVQEENVTAYFENASNFVQASPYIHTSD